MFADHKASLHADSEPEEKVLVQTRFQSTQDWGDCMGRKLRFQEAGESSPTLESAGLNPFCKHPPPPTSLRNVLLKVKQVDSEREQ